MTELVFILDRSGSMAGLEKDTIGGFNSMIEKQKKEAGSALVTTVLFDGEITMIHDRIPLEEVPAMTDKEYFPRGSTALMDAIGETVTHISKVHRYIRREDLPEKTLFVITTDGYENSSRHYDSEKVKKLISEKKKNGWDFIFLGANMDAAKEAAKVGISEDMAATYRCDEEGTALNFEAIGSAVLSARASGCVPMGWKKKIEERR